ncbi:DUF6960 family protein [Flagellimonas crocea]|uniref:DUF6960 family protein n=1 Tax=Flagellimonas crocea TaxID=3067311 RepID=UPI00296E6660|nr:hypothetical protein [Muricauda sp. DH64]
MKEFLNKWLWLDLLFYKDEFQEINKLNLVHPLDVDNFKSNPINMICHCVGNEDDYLVVENKGHKYRVKKEAIKQLMPTPKFKWNEKIFQIGKPDVEAIIDDFFWHHKDQKYYYHITVNGKKKSKRYSENELMPINT